MGKKVETIEGYKKLDLTWVLPFKLLGFPKVSSVLCRCFMLKGTKAQRQRLKRDLLDYHCPDDVY